MGILGKLGQKLGDAMEKSASKNMTGSSKEVYENEQKEKKAFEESRIIEPMISVPFSKEDLKDLDQLLLKADIIDERHLWVAGFPNHRANQNASAANVFTGKKHLRFFAVKEENFSFAFFEDDIFKTYRIFKENDIKSAEVKTKMLGAGTLRIELKDGKILTIDVTENKDKLQSLKGMFN